MLHAIIDIGSNTIRLSVYDCSQNGTFSRVSGKKAAAGLAGYVRDGEMTEKGVRAACEALSSFQSMLSHLKTDSVSVFATASLRNITNSAAAAETIQKETGYHVEILSGEEEARLDFAGAMLDAKTAEGLVTDIGGGSCELVRFSECRSEKAVSLPLGSLKLYTSFVKELFPTQQEEILIRREVLRALQAADPEAGNCKTVLGVGGSLRYGALLCAEMGEGTAQSFSVKGFRNVLTRLCRDHSFALEQVMHTVPERLHTLIPGMLLFDVGADYYRCEQVFISSYGVREGFLTERILKNALRNEQTLSL